MTRYKILTALVVAGFLFTSNAALAQFFPAVNECGSGKVYQEYAKWGAKSYFVYFPKDRMDNIIGTTTSAGSLMGLDCYFSIDKEGNKGIATIVNANPDETWAKRAYEQASQNPSVQGSTATIANCTQSASGTSTQGAAGIAQKNNMVFTVSVDKLPNVTTADVEDILSYACGQVSAATTTAPVDDSPPVTNANPDNSNPTPDQSSTGSDKSWVLYVIGALVLALIALIVKAIMSAKAAPAVVAPPPVQPEPVVPPVTPSPPTDPTQNQPPTVSS